MEAKFRFKDKLLYLRLNRLTHTPPAFQGAQILSEKGFPLLAFEYGKENRKETLVSSGICIRRYGKALFKFLPHKLQSAVLLIWTFCYLAFKIQSEGKPRFIVAHGLQEQWLAFQLNRLFQIPYAVHVHELYVEKDVSGLNLRLLQKEGAALRGADFLIFAGQERAKAYREIYKLTNDTLSVFNGPRLRTPPLKSDLRAKLGVDPKAFLALYIGGLGPRNALEELILAAELAPKNLVLLLAGFGEPDYELRLKKLIQERKLDSKVKLMGRVPNKWDWIDHVDLGICLYQPVELRLMFVAGASNKLFEFISSGVPVVVNSQPDFVKMVSHNELGVCATELTPKSIAKAIQRIMEDSGYRMNAALKGKRLHREVFNFDRQFEPVVSRLEKWFPESKSNGAVPTALAGQAT